MTREHIKFGMIQTEEAFQSLIQFAESFNHTVGSDSILPIYTIERGDHMIGYANVLLQPIVAPALHPKMCTPRDFYDAIMTMKNHYCLNSISQKFPNGTCFMSLPTVPVIENRVFERCGFQNTNKELWQAIP